MKKKEDLISNLFKSSRVVIQGDFKPITCEQYQTVQNAAKMIIDSGLNVAVTCFYVDCSGIKSQINYEGVHLTGNKLPGEFDLL